jgi:predicted ATPase
MFTHLGLKNFRAFESLELDLARITILVGPNNSGKSSILSALRILAQTVRNEDYRIPLMLNGPFGEFGTYKDLVFQNEKERKIGIAIGTTIARRGPSREVNLNLSFSYRSQRREVILLESVLTDDAGRKVYSTRGTHDPQKQIFEIFGLKNGSESTPALTRKSTRLIHFLARPYTALGRFSSTAKLSSEHTRAFMLADSAFNELIQGFRSMEYLGPFRAEPARTNLFSGESPTSVGVDGARAIDMLASDYLRRGRRKKELLNRVLRWLVKASIAKDFKIRLLSDRHFEVLIQHPITQEFENLADVGYGSSQVLPVIAGGYNMPGDSTFVVEQPELHLHPAAQSELGDFFVDLYERKVNSIIETHSEHLILRLQTHVAQGRIRPQDFVVYFVYPSATNKTVVKLTLGDDGVFQQEWPQGFFEERLKEVTALARAPLGGD